MKTIILNSETVESEPGTIALCPHMGCGFTCCNFQQGNYIVLYPDELEAAIRSGASIKHLKLLENYHGGFKIVCSAINTATCDSGFKPLDCRSYPYFPTVVDGKIVANLKGKKCPLPTSKTNEHTRYVQEEWEKIACQKPSVLTWLGKVELVGYGFATDASEIQSNS